MFRGGDIIGGRYLLGAPLGEGEDAVVYTATDLRLERRVAIKLRTQAGDQFLKSAKISASVHHPHVVAIVDFGIDGNVAYLVMELLNGITLRERLKQDSVVSSEEAVEIGALVLRGLGAVHRASIVHRGLTPANIFLTNEGEKRLPKLVGFPGSDSEPPHDTGGPRQRTAPEYMSPEQVRGLADVDERTDIYSVGVILYEALSGQLPYESENARELALRITAGAAPRLSRVAKWVPESLSKVVGRAMERNRDRRYGTAREMLEALLEASEALDMPNRVEVTGTFRLVHATGESPQACEETREGGRAVTLTLDEEADVPDPSKKSRGRAVLVAAATLVLSAGVVSAAISMSEEERVVAAPGPPVTQMSDPEAPQPTTVEVRLTGVPEGATLRLDSIPTAHPIVMMRDGARHAIEVGHPDYETWRVEHVADGPGEYSVHTIPAATPIASVEVTSPTPRVEPIRPRRGTASMDVLAGQEEPAEAEEPATEEPALAEPDETVDPFRTLDY